MKWIPICLLVLVFLGCKSKPQAPDVSKIPVKLNVLRFEDAFFGLDTNHLEEGLNELERNYPGFAKDFLFNIMGTTPSTAVKDIKSFTNSYRLMYDSAKKNFSNFQPVTNQVELGLKYVKYYFPNYAVPTNLVTFIGPINSYGNIITTDALAVGLQLYMGRGYSLYQSDMGQQLYPLYLSRRFEQAYIPVNCMNNIIEDLYPNKSLGMALVDQLVETGKRQYVLDHLLPNFSDSLKLGYTQEQVEICNKNESNIWAFFIQNNLLYVTEPEITKEYMNEAPNTPALGSDFPGFIGRFVGWKMVQKYMDNHADIDLAKLMETPPRKIFEEAKYKPR
ncbi:MAG: hypothetical protein B7Y15_13300 [Bacteroidetes bacterium 24-39-8]|jgi:hypothetical protein|nr:MAG: hypothetical protein B7Y15_13300 [Bacteroidetes bacterium 24-39-8]OZA68179.1 MAG: hypothetical protein B7X72_02325 [Sphingobacteriia bacterium 39-39-8]HQR92183.1 hypothetical protein [Sediminibacterium sp.]HQS54927.1 hypothetical protein [Sediminibacterium sp.]